MAGRTAVRSEIRLASGRVADEAISLARTIDASFAIRTGHVHTGIIWHALTVDTGLAISTVGISRTCTAPRPGKTDLPLSEILEVDVAIAVSVHEHTTCAAG